MGQSYGSSYQNTPGARASDAQDAVQSIKRRAEDAADTVATEGAKAMRAAGETAEDAFEATKRFVQTQPVLAIGAVAIFACAVGALWKMSSARRGNDLVDRLSDYVEPGYRALRKRF